MHVSMCRTEPCRLMPSPRGNRAASGSQHRMNEALARCWMISSSDAVSALSSNCLKILSALRATSNYTMLGGLTSVASNLTRSIRPSASLKMSIRFMSAHPPASGWEAFAAVASMHNLASFIEGEIRFCLSDLKKMDLDLDISEITIALRSPPHGSPYISIHLKPAGFRCQMGAPRDSVWIQHKIFTTPLRLPPTERVAVRFLARCLRLDSWKQ